MAKTKDAEPTRGAEQILDLDVLKPPARYILLSGKKLDIAFIPSGIALEVMARQNELMDLASEENLAEIAKGGEVARSSFDIAAEICALITSAQDPEVNKEYLLNHTNIQQLNALISAVTSGVFASLSSMDDGTDEETAEEQTAKKS